jgi:hypothetical protein
MRARISLQWWQVRDLDGVNPRLDLPSSKTKTKRDRVVPISSRLKAILEMRRNDPAGEPHGPSRVSIAHRYTVN